MSEIGLFAIQQIVRLRVREHSQDDLGIWWYIM